MGKELLPSCVVLAASLMLCPSGQGAVQQANSSSTTAYAVSSTDLVNSGALSLAGVTATVVSTGNPVVPGDTVVGAMSNLNNGSIGTAPVSSFWTSGSTYFSWGTGDVALTFALNTAVNTLGYDITSIGTYSATGDNSIWQDYDIYYTTVSSTTPVLMGSYVYRPESERYAQILLTADGDGIMASGVASVIFVIHTPRNESGDAIVANTIWREFDVEGVATVPEPAAIGMLGFGALMLTKRRR